GELQCRLGEPMINIPEDFLTTDIVGQVYGASIDGSDISSYCDKAIVCPLNEDCNILNQRVLTLLSGTDKCYTSVDSIRSDDPSDQINIPLEYLHSIIP